MPTGIQSNLEGFRMSGCSLADDKVAKVSSDKVSSIEFDVYSFRHSKRTSVQVHN